ncbi:MAG: hypothetical protein D6741_20785 [Planctomycetota bacterium]|nr:MAG: hypothetical protein D6741_20785 [Planctomycetota bacterium]
MTIPSALAVRRSGAIAVLSVDRPGRRRFADAGRALQRLWLQATLDGLAVHPLGSLPIFLAHEEIAEGRKLAEHHRRECRRLRESLDKVLPQVRDRCPVMALRVGVAPSVPAVRSLRRPSKDCLITFEEA